MFCGAICKLDLVPDDPGQSQLYSINIIHDLYEKFLEGGWEKQYDKHILQTCSFARDAVLRLASLQQPEIIYLVWSYIQHNQI